ncbi:MAG: hypothetical protein M3Z09_16190 [Acidobacteriota bacterium]|nr:hypothetical protein [Acidobacteriota bacterium]
MNRVALGVVLGVAAGAISVGLMAPMQFPDKRRALLAAFLNRFALGFLAANTVLPGNGVASGAAVGLLVSASEAVITKTCAPILILGVVFGAVCGWAAQSWATR